MCQLLHVFLRDRIEFRNDDAYIMPFFGKNRREGPDNITEPACLDKRN